MSALKYTAEEFEAKVKEYFEYVDKENERRRQKRFSDDKFKPYTLSGLCVYLDISRETWREYSNKPEYVDTVKRARVIVENYTEENLINGKLNAIGAIFSLKNNFNWVDKQEVTVNGEVKPISQADIKDLLKPKKLETSE